MKYNVKKLHHFAWRCKDAEATRVFYEDICGLPLSHVIRTDKVPGGSEVRPHIQLFFEMDDGSYISFYDLGDDMPGAPSPNTPAWVNHLALEVDSVETLAKMRDRLEKHGVDVLGITDHTFLQSIYFFDPNGFRVEFTTRTDAPGTMAAHASEAHELIEAWTREKQVKTV